MVKMGFRKKMSLMLISLMLVTAAPSGVWAEEGTSGNQDGSITAPLNPAFVQYIEELKSGTLQTTAAGAYARGHIPAPLARFEGTETTDMATSASLPADYDLRSTGQVSAIRDQGDYGSCWAFASFASLESYLKKQGSTDLSENNLMWNHGYDMSPYDGGNGSVATAYLARWSGPVNESSDPYGSVKKQGLSAAYHVQKVEDIPDSQTAIKQALMEGGALYMSMYADAFDSYNYFNEGNAALYYDGNSRTNHDVAIVGWDDNYDRNNFNKTPPGNGAWIIRNSWGTDWGDNGYFYMSYYDTYAGSDVTAFHNTESTDNYSRIYQYDPLGETSSRGYGTSTTSGANIFTAAASENLTAVSTYALAPNSSLEIKVYVNVNAGDPLSGELKSAKTVTLARGGYHTIKLDTPVALTAGQRFSVVVKYSTPGYNYPVPVEAPMWGYSSAASANSGQSFISEYGSGNWYDLSSSDETNVCIKAFTGGGEMALLQSIAVTSPAAKLNYQIGDSLDLSGLVVTGTYSDGTKKAETITSQNVTGFNSSAAMTNQVLTINVDGKTTTYQVQILAAQDPGTTGEFIAFLGLSQDMIYYEYDQTDLNASYKAYTLNPTLPSAKMYQHFINNGCQMVAFKDRTKGYMDYQAIAFANIKAALNQVPFKINEYLGRSDAKPYEKTVTNVKVVDKQGNVIY